MMQFEEAFRRLVMDAHPLSTERRAIEGAVGFVLAVQINARRSQPGIALAAMDGYAVNSSDLSGAPQILPVDGETAAGAAQASHKAGTAHRIFTGAALPTGADQIIVQEDATFDGNRISFQQHRNSGRHVRSAGIDFSEGEVLLDAGTYLSPKIIALLASAGHSHVMVHRAPKIAIFSTGDELVSADKSSFDPIDMVDSNTPMVQSLLQEAGGIITTTERLKDDLDSMISALKATDADIVITIGGASVGDHDHILKAYEALGVTVDINKIKLRPGKPFKAGRLGAQRFIALPGNANSAFVTALLFVRPLLDRMMRRPVPPPEGIDLPIAVDLPPSGPRDHFMLARLIGETGSRQVDPAQSQDSSLVSVLAACDGLLLHRANSDGYKAGDRLPFFPF